MMAAALYTRVSTKEQTTENQIIELTNYCEKEKIEIYKIYNEEGISGTKTTRPQLDLMMQEMRQKKFDTILVWKFDRLGRSTSHLLQVLEELKNKNVRLISISQNIDTNTPMGKFFFVIMTGFAEMERELITERIYLGIARAKKQLKDKGTITTKEGVIRNSLGRPAGAKDKERRRKSGYLMRWIKEKNNGILQT